MKKAKPPDKKLTNNTPIDIVYYTSQSILENRRLPVEVNEVLTAYTAASKNIYNAALFEIRQLIASYHKIVPVDKENSNDNNDKVNKINENTTKSDIILYQKIDNLQPNCIEVLNRANIVINLLNNKKDDLSKSKKLKLLSGIKPRKSTSQTPDKIRKSKYYNNYEEIIERNTYFQFLDTNLICNLLKYKEKQSTEYKDYTTVPSHIAQSVVMSAVEDIKNFYKAITAYRKNPANFLGKPQLPNYKDKDSNSGFSLSKFCFTKDGVVARAITKDNIYKFTSIKDKTNTNKLYTNSLKEKQLSIRSINAYNEFRFMPFIENKISEVLKSEREKLQYFYRINDKQISETELNTLLNIEFVELKITPLKAVNRFKHTVKIEIVLKHTVKLLEQNDNKNNNKRNIKSNNFDNREKTKNKNILPYNLLNKALKVNAKFLELSETDKVAFIAKHFPKVYKTHSVASLDLGVVNHAAMTFNNRSKGLVISGQKYRAELRKQGIKLDKLISQLTPEAIKTIQSTHDTRKSQYNTQKNIIIEQIKASKQYLDIVNACLIGENKTNKELAVEKYLKTQLDKQLPYPVQSKTDKELIKFNYKTLNENQKIVNIRNYIKNYKSQTIHQLSDKILDICILQKTSLLIIGKNIGWKNKINIGKRNNRDNYSFPHTEFIKTLQYKALRYGIVILTVEESYTSRTSFINNSKLKTFSDKILIEEKQTNIEDINIANENEILIANHVNNINLNPASDTFATKISSLNKQTTNDKLQKNISVVKSNPMICDNKINKNNPYGGYRSDRNTFKNKIDDSIKGSAKPRIVHADINGSFNIMRKVFTQLKYDKTRHNTQYDIYALQPNKQKLRQISIYA